MDTSDAEWQEAFDQTLYPAIRASRLAVPHMRARGGGAIVMITSIWGRESGGRMTYNAVKAAETSLAKSLAQQLAPHNIRVVGVAPGSILFPGGSWHKRQQADPEGIAEFVKRELAVWPLRARRGGGRGRRVSRLAAGQLGERRVGRRRRLSVQVEPLAGYTPRAMIPASVSDAIQSTADALYVPWLVILLFGSGLFLTLRFGVVQLRRFREALGTFVATQDASAGGALSPFQAFMTALAATIGTGNIAGVAAGIVSGGPGALFWIWCYGFVATAVKFSEAVLGVTFRDVAGGRTRTGPMYYLRDGLKSPALAWVYALIAGVAALTTTPFTQTNSIALVWNTQFGVPTWASGVLIAVLTWLVIIGGIQSIGKAAERLTPLKVGLYLAGGLIVIVSFASRIPDVLALVFREAFSTRAAAGGAMGFLIAMRYGLARGMYANEAGYGTAAVAYGTARSRRPAAQGLNAVMEVFIVSFVTSTISAMVVLAGGVGRGAAIARRPRRGQPHEHGRRRAFLQPGRALGGRAGWWPSACFSSATPRSSAGRSTASSFSSTSSARVS